MTRRVDLRSDTVTQPTPAMRDAMAKAVVGDDGYSEDPTINELEQRFAELVGKEAALFVVSGVMANQIALRVLAQPGDVIVAGRGQHLLSFEMGAAARNSSVQFATVDDTNGTLELADVLEAIDAEGDHQPHVAMVTVENTHMLSGGTPWDAEDLRRRPDKAAGRGGGGPRHDGDDVSLERTVRSRRVVARGTGLVDGARARGAQAPRRRDAPSRFLGRRGSRRSRHHGRATEGRSRARAPARRTLRRRFSRVGL